MLSKTYFFASAISESIMRLLVEWALMVLSDYVELDWNSVERYLLGAFQDSNVFCGSVFILIRTEFRLV